MKNRKAYFDYELIDKYIAGIVLFGTEIKSIREGKAHFTDTYCYIKDNEIFIKNLHISEFDNALDNHEPNRDRKLLLTKKQIKKLYEKMKLGSYTIVPTRMFFNDKNLCKVEIYLAKGKKEFNKKNKIKESDIEREKDRELQNYK